MAVTILMLDGTATEVEPRPDMGCKEFLIEEGIMAGPPETWNVVAPDQQEINDRPIMDFQGKKIQVVPAKAPGATG